MPAQERDGERQLPAHKDQLMSMSQTAMKEGTAMLWLKGCLRCGGDLYEGADYYGQYIACLQCSYYLTEAEQLPLRHMAWPRSVEISEKAA